MKVKICGLTNLEDARTAVDLGADLLGFNFYPPSTRYISPKAAAEIIHALRAYRPTIRMVGIFVNESPFQVQSVLDACNLDSAQLSGDESPEELHALGGRAFKALRPSTHDSALDLASQFALLDGQPALLVDASLPGAYGGTGNTADWETARLISARYPLLLAGGLTPENITAAIHTVQPWGVDVATGVETTPGRKDPQKMARFIERAHELASGVSQ